MSNLPGDCYPSWMEDPGKGYYLVEVQGKTRGRYGWEGYRERIWVPEKRLLTLGGDLRGVNEIQFRVIRMGIEKKKEVKSKEKNGLLIKKKHFH